MTPKPWKITTRHHRSKFSDGDLSLDQEVIKSEFLRSALLILLFIMIFFVAIANYFLLEADLSNYYGGRRTFLILLGSIASFIVYQSINMFYLRTQVTAGRTTTFRYKLIHTMLEVSFPSTIMFIMMIELNKVSFIDTPIMSTYFLFIILSILHLDFRVSIFAGAFAGLQYALITYYGFEYVNTDPVFEDLLPSNSHYLRSVIMLFCGGAAGFVSRELNQRIKSAFDFRAAKDKVELLFGQQVSKEVSQALMAENEGTTRREATVMFLDIRNFTSFADAHAAEDVIDYQNKFVGPIIDIINAHQGVVFQILGDGLMACFGSPVENALHADMAFQSSISILRHVDEASKRNEIPPTRIGIGLHCGLVVTGNIGNERRKQFSISGSPVIVASRIEQLNKKYGTQLLISGEVHEKIIPGKIKISSFGKEILRGIEKPVEIFNVEAVSVSVVQHN